MQLKLTIGRAMLRYAHKIVDFVTTDKSTLNLFLFLFILVYFIFI